MKPTPINAVLMAPFLMMMSLTLPVQAQENWSGAGMHPVPGVSFTPNQGQIIRHEVHANAAPSPRVETPRRVQPAARPAPHSIPAPVGTHPLAVRHDRQPNHVQTKQHPMPGYFRRDVNYYGHVPVIFPYADVDQGFVVLDGFELVTVNGETFYYHQGIFYQQVGDQLTAIPAVLGAVVDSIPEDYQIVMADGVHYLVTGGVYYQRVDQGFEVVQPLVSDQE